MIRLFITLYLMVLASFGVFLIFGTGLDTLGENIGDGAVIDEKVSRGVFTLLDESIAGLDEQKIQAVVEKHKKVFGPEFKLLEISQLDLDKGLIKDIKKNQIVSTEQKGIVLVLDHEESNVKEEPQEPRQLREEEDLTILYRRHSTSTKVWRVHLDFEVDQSINDSGIGTSVTSAQYAEGMFSLIQSKLLENPENEWKDTIQKLQVVFGFPVSLKKLDEVTHEFSPEKRQLSLIQNNRVINITQGSKDATFVKRLGDTSNVMQIGPVEIPWVMRNFIYLMLLAFALSFATTMFLWILPLWSNLTKIKKAADEFGEGNYDTRIPYKKYSAIAKVSEAFNSMAERTQRSIRSHKELTTAVSHELRTPVARMRFALEMLSSGDEDDRKRFIKDIGEDIDELDLLLEELLTYARFEQEIPGLKFSLEKLIPWISTSMEKLVPLADDKILNYRVEGIGVNETALIEPRLMSRVLDNLVQNALRYAKRNVEVTLSKDNDDYLLIVDDDGVGIPEAEREHIFEAFTRIDASRDRKSGGFGLGLAIVKRILKGHRGEVHVEDSPLGGARFEVRWNFNVNQRSLKESLIKSIRS